MDEALIDLLIGYATREHRACIEYKNYLEFLEAYAYNNNLNDLIQKVRDQRLEIIPTLMQWEFKGACSLVRQENQVTGIIIHCLLKELLASVYTQIENNPEIPFPDDSYFGFVIPEKLIQKIDVQNEFVSYLEEINNSSSLLAKLLFPYGIKNIIVPRDIVKTRLCEAAMAKLSRYLQFKMNIGYMHNRLENILSGNYEAIKNMLNEVLTKPKKAFENLLEADDFSYRFFAQFTAIIIKDFRDKTTRHEDEHGFVQAALIISFFAGYQKSIRQREQQRKMELSLIEKQLCRPPYAYSLQDLLELKDSKGTRYIDKYSKEFIYDFIRKLTRPQDNTQLPSLIIVKVNNEKEYFIHKNNIIILFLNLLKDASTSLYRDYLEEWQTLAKNNIRLPSMKNDADFLSELIFKIHSRFPLLQALYDSSLLVVLRQETSLNDQQKLSLAECFVNPTTLKPLTELLSLSREKILAAVYTILPVWYSIPFIKHIFFFFKWLFGKSNRSFKAKALKLWKEVKQELKPQVHEEYRNLLAEARETKRHSATPKEASQKYRNQLEKLKAELIGPQTDLESLLENLAEKWNPLFEKQAKANLIEDVNCFVRDYLRRVKKTLKNRPPTKDQIKEYAALLVANKNLAKIKKKEALRSYLEAYMLKVLQEIYHY